MLVISSQPNGQWYKLWASDDAPQFKLLTDDLSLCWVHEGRHYKKLKPLVAYHQQLLDKFREDFWGYYRKLLIYKEAPSAAVAEMLREEFDQLFGTESGYQQLDERKRLTRAKISELLLVLDHPELPLHLGSCRVSCQNHGAATPKRVMGLKPLKELKLGILSCLLCPLLINWASAFLNMCATALRRQEQFLLWLL